MPLQYVQQEDPEDPEDPQSNCLDPNLDLKLEEKAKILLLGMHFNKGQLNDSDTLRIQKLIDNYPCQVFSVAEQNRTNIGKLHIIDHY